MGRAEEVLRMWFLEIWNKGRIDLYPQLATDDLALHTVGMHSERLVGLKGFLTLYEPLRGAFPDITFNVEEIVEAGNSAAIRWTCIGTHKGDHLGVKATHKTVRISGMAFVRMRGGKVAESWDEWDRQGFIAQIATA